MQQILYQRSAAAWILQGHGLSPRSQCSTSSMRALNCCYILKHLWVDIKEDIGIIFKIIRQTPALSSSMTACSGGTQNLLATSHWDLEVRLRLSRWRLQLHLSCLSRTTLAWATNIWVTKYAPLHANPWMDLDRQASSDYTQHTLPARNAAATVTLVQKPERQGCYACCGVTFITVT